MSTKTNLLVDFGIFSAFLLATLPDLTGISIHEWLSVALAGAIIAHLLLHWKWITGVLSRFFKKLWRVSRLKFLVDALLFVAFTTVMLSGIMISRSVLPALNIQLSENFAMHMIHSFSANAALILVGFHFALNWNWVVNAVKRYVINPVSRALHPTRELASVRVEIDEHRSLQ